MKFKLSVFIKNKEFNDFQKLEITLIENPANTNVYKVRVHLGEEDINFIIIAFYKIQ